MEIPKALPHNNKGNTRMPGKDEGLGSRNKRYNNRSSVINTEVPPHLVSGPSYQMVEKAMAPHSSILENPMDGEPGRLQSMGSLRVGHD